MTSENPPTPTTDDLPPMNPEMEKNACVPMNGHISQIPGLSPILKPLSEDRARGRRVGVLASDSEYVKLAKQGGYKGLLWHNDSSFTSSPRSYKPPDWFSDAHDANGNPSLITREHKRSPRAFQRREPPFGNDNLSAWERQGSSTSTSRENNNIPDEETEKLQEKLPSQKLEHGKFRRIVFDKKPAPVNMSTLLSFGYVEELKPTA